MTNFSISCSGWRDENNKAYRDEKKDGAPDNVKYEYRMFIPALSQSEAPDECSDYTLLGYTNSDSSPPMM